MAQDLVGADAAGDEYLGGIELLCRLAGLFDQYVNDSHLEAGCQVGHGQGAQGELDHRGVGRRLDLVGVALDNAQDRCLEPGEAEIKAAPQTGAGQVKGSRVASLSRLLDGWPTWIPQPHQAGHLVKSLAGCVVQGAAQHFVIQMPPHKNELGMPTGDDEAHRWKARFIGRAVRFEPVGVKMAFEVIDGDQR